MKAKHRFERAQALHVAAKELAVVSVNEFSFKSLSIRYFQADYIDEAEKSNQSPTTWNETYEHAIAKVCAKDSQREIHDDDVCVGCSSGTREISGGFRSTTCRTSLFRNGQISGEIAERLSTSDQ